MRCIINLYERRRGGGELTEISKEEEGREGGMAWAKEEDQSVPFRSPIER